MNIRVILADDHPVVTVGIRKKLEAASGISVVAEASNPTMLMEALERAPCDVLVTDFSMPCDERPDGLVMLRSIHGKYPKLHMVVLTMLENKALVKSILNSGALVVVSKRYELSRFPEIVVAAFHGRCSSPYYDAKGPMLLSPMEGPDIPLSPRELEVLRLYVNGMSITELALHLNRSIKTVSTQKSNVMRKLGLVSDAELFSYALENGLIA